MDMLGEFAMLKGLSGVVTKIKSVRQETLVWITFPSGGVIILNGDYHYTLPW